METVLEAPAPQTTMIGDFMPEAGNTDAIDRETVRWVVNCGDLALPQLQRTWPELAIGGDVIGTNVRTLYRSKYLLRRAEMSIMSKAFDWTNADSLGDEKDKTPSVESYDEISRQMVTRYGYPCYPGDEIKTLISPMHSQNDHGIREIEILRGIGEEEVLQENYQRILFNGSEYFPPWDVFLAMTTEDRKPFNKLSALERHLALRYEQESSSVLQGIIETYNISCQQFRIWGDEELDREARKVKSPMTAGGFVHTFSPTAAKLFEQLEVTRDEYLRREHNIPVVADSSALNEKMVEMMGQMSEVVKILVKEKADTTTTEDVVVKSSYPMHAKVSVNNLIGEVVGKPGGRYTVEFEDKSKETFNYDELALISE